MRAQQGLWTESAMRFAKRCIPQPISGRWGCVDVCALRVREPGRAMLEPVTRVVLARNKFEADEELHKLRCATDDARPKPSPKELGHGDHGGQLVLDELAWDDRISYRATRGRWRRDVLYIHSQELFFVVNDIGLRARAPLAHHRRFTQKKMEAADIYYHGNIQSQLVCGKAQAIHAEFAEIFSSASQEEWLLQLVDMAPQCGVSANELLALTVELVCHHAANYKRRFVDQADDFPFCLCRVAATPLDQFCADRQRIGCP
jgi:hypothetical protein